MNEENCWVDTFLEELKKEGYVADRSGDADWLVHPEKKTVVLIAYPRVPLPNKLVVEDLDRGSL